MFPLPPDWSWQKLEDTADVILGQSPPGSSYNSDGIGVPFFQGKAEFGELKPTVVKWTTDPKRFAETGDVLLSVRAPVGPTNVAPFDCCVGRGLAALRAGPNLTPAYLLYWMRASAVELASAGTGTTFKAVSGKQVRSHPIPVPPIDEQHRIVEAIETHLSHLDAGVESLERAKRNVERMRVSALHSLFDGIDAQVVALGDLAEVVGGVTKDKKSEQDPMTVEVPYLRVANVQRGYLDLSEVRIIRVRPEKVERLLLEKGDILFTEGGDRDKLGRGWVWEEQIDRCIHQNHVFRARPYDGGVLPKFVSTYANVFGREWFERMGKQTTNLASISLTNLRKFPVPLPSIEIQRQIMGQVDLYSSILGAVTDAVDMATTRGETLRAAVLSSAFNGQLDHTGRGRVHS